MANKTLTSNVHLLKMTLREINEAEVLDWRVREHLRRELLHATTALIEEHRSFLHAQVGAKLLSNSGGLR